MILLLLTLLFVGSQSPAQTPAQAPGQLSGRVVAADTGAPVRAAEVRLQGLKPDTGPRIATTDVEGRFELQNVAVGQYSLWVSKAGFVRTSFGAKPDGPATIDVTPRQKIDVGALALPRGGAITGRVVDSFGDAVADAAVTAWRVEFTMPALRRVLSVRSFQSNDLGEFRLYGLAPGKYYVSAALKSGPLADAPTFYPGAANLAQAQTVEVKAGEDTFGLMLPLTVTPYGIVTGVVLNSKGVPYATAVAGLVSARTDGVSVNTVQLIAPTDAEGRFRIINVTPGDYRVEIFSRAYLEKVGTDGTIGTAPAGEVASAPVSVGAGRTEEVAIQATPGFTVRGRIFLDGAPLPGAQGMRVAAMPATSGISATGIPSSSEIARDGSFVMTAVQGRRLLRADGLAPGAFLHHVLVGGADVTEVGFDAVSDINDAELHLTSRPARLEGTITTASGAPATDARRWIVVFSTHRAEWMTPGTRRYHSIRATNDGTFLLPSIPAGSYLAAVVPPEDRDRWADPDYLENLRARATAFTASDGSTSKVALVLVKR